MLSYLDHACSLVYHLEFPVFLYCGEVFYWPRGLEYDHYDCANDLKSKLYYIFFNDPKQ